MVKENHKGKPDNVNYFKAWNVSSTKARETRQSDLEKIFAMHINDKGLLCRMHKELPMFIKISVLIEK